MAYKKNDAARPLPPSNLCAGPTDAGVGVGVDSTTADPTKVYARVHVRSVIHAHTHTRGRLVFVAVTGKATFVVLCRNAVNVISTVGGGGTRVIY